MENKINLGANLKADASKKIKVGATLKNADVFTKEEYAKLDKLSAKEKGKEKQHEPYLLPCGNSSEYCFLQVKRKNAIFCKTWKKSIWGHCRWRVETPQHKWENR